VARGNASSRASLAVVRLQHLQARSWAPRVRRLGPRLCDVGKAPKATVGRQSVVRRDGHRSNDSTPTDEAAEASTARGLLRLPAIAAAAAQIKAKSFTIDGEAVVLGPDGLSRFDELRRREAARTAVLYAFDLIEHDGEDLRNRPFLDRKAALARLLRDTEAGILLNEHVAEDGPTVFAHACRLGAEGIVSKRVDSAYRSGPCSAWIKVRNPASIAIQRERSENWNR